MRKSQLVSDYGCIEYYFKDILVDSCKSNRNNLDSIIDTDDSDSSQTATSSALGSCLDDLESDASLLSLHTSSDARSEECFDTVSSSIHIFNRKTKNSTKNSLRNSTKSNLKKKYDGIQSPECIIGKICNNEEIVAGSSALILLDRPPNIPAKSIDEQLEHKKLYEQVIQNAKKKENESFKKQKEYLKQKLKNEERLASVTQIWNQEIIPNWNTMSQTKRCRDLWWNGLPSSVRGKVWSLAIGNDLFINEELYKSCVTNSATKFKDSNDCSVHCLEYIYLDITRTFPHLGIFQQGGPYFDVLKRILSAFVCLRPDVGYIQGMCFIAAILLLNMEELPAFICLVNLMETQCLKTFYTVNHPMMTSYFLTYSDLLKHNLSKLSIHFNKIGLTPEMYLVEWIYTVYTKSMNLELASIIWDNFLRENDSFLFQTALGILYSNETELLQMDSIMCAQFLTKLPDSFTSSSLLKSTALIRMSIGKKSFNDLLLNHQKNIH
ncbi:TBC1 domain family member 12-like isoform X2 [Daktulosphaira vitifoliae]|uniref:TBC1 domain family member 12-like isoform X2 n=1 Tax=Daktulosphaira vitifoliae TaxID=58002 RepID=UPI0021AA1573|nr:TBC1 domain family member 12-like isoform X2 [Daktulosphaira vitifoliae]